MLQALLDTKQPKASLPPFSRDACARIKAYPVIGNGDANPPTVPSDRDLYSSGPGMFDRVDERLLYCPTAQRVCDSWRPRILTG